MDTLIVNKKLDFDIWIKEENEKDTLRWMVCGNVDDGKSTMIGHLLWSLGCVQEDYKIKAVRKKKSGESYIDFSLIMDSLMDEQDQGITIDVAYRFFATRKRKFILADTPGHEEFTRNMITAASQCDLAVLLIDAEKGIQDQTKRHAYILSWIGIEHIVVAINKMDAVAFDEKTYQRIKKDFEEVAQEMHLSVKYFIPISGLIGDNLTKKSENMSWYDSLFFMEILEKISLHKNTYPHTVVSVSKNYHISHERGLHISILSGSLKKGDCLKLSRTNKLVHVSKVYTAQCSKGSYDQEESIACVIDEKIDISRGDILASESSGLHSVKKIKANICWFDESFGKEKEEYYIKLGHQWSIGYIEKIESLLDINELKRINKSHIMMNDFACVMIYLLQPLVVEKYSLLKGLGSFLLISKENKKIISAGIVEEVVNDKVLPIEKVSISDREKNMGQAGHVIWLTGLSGAGKTTLAENLEINLHRKGKKTFILDGDELRKGINRDLNFTETDRHENIRRISEIANLMRQAGVIVIVAAISPYQSDREQAKKIIGEKYFTEIYVSTPLSVCLDRDPKGLYQKAQSGQIEEMTGIKSIYEEPINPDLNLNTQYISVEESVSKICTFLEKEVHGFL